MVPFFIGDNMHVIYVGLLLMTLSDIALAYDYVYTVPGQDYYYLSPSASCGAFTTELNSSPYQPNNYALTDITQNESTGHGSCKYVRTYDNGNVHSNPSWSFYRYPSSNDTKPHFDAPSQSDQQCLAIDTSQEFVVLSSLPGEGETFVANGCQFEFNGGVGFQKPNGEWVVGYDPIGADPDLPAEGDVTADEGLDLPSDISVFGGTLTPSSDVATECPFSNVSSGGQSYCYQGDDAPQGADYPDGSTRVDYYDGTYTVTDSQGNSTDYKANGSPLHPDTAPTGAGDGPSDDPSETPPPSPWSAGDSALQSFDSDNEGEQMIADAKQRLSDAVDVIRADMASMSATVSGGGSCPSAVDISLGGGSATLDVCEKLNDWGGAVRSAVLLLGALLSFSILLRARD